MDFLWVQSGQQRKIARDHEALDMVRVGMLDRLANRLRQAMHVGFTGPVKFRQWPRRGKRVAFHIFWTSVPIDPAHIFAPADDLPDEPLGCVNWHFACAILHFNRAAQVKRVKQTRVDIRRKDRVPQKRFSGEHCILIVPKTG